MKKQLLFSLMLLSVPLVACQKNTSPHITDVSSPPVSTQKTSTTNNTKKEETASSQKDEKKENATTYQVKIPKNAPHKQHFANEYLEFEGFRLEEVKGKPKSDNRFEFELEWRNLTDENKIFSDLGTAIILQDGKETSVDFDGDYFDSLKPQDDEDFEGKFVLNGNEFILEVTDNTGHKVSFGVTLTN